MKGNRKFPNLYKNVSVSLFFSILVEGGGGD
jgi:hypothetical protein